MTNMIEILYQTSPTGTPCTTINISSSWRPVSQIISDYGYTRGYVYTVGSDTFLDLVEADKKAQ